MHTRNRLRARPGSDSKVSYHLAFRRGAHALVPDDPVVDIALAGATHLPACPTEPVFEPVKVVRGSGEWVELTEEAAAELGLPGGWLEDCSARACAPLTR